MRKPAYPKILFFLSGLPLFVGPWLFSSDQDQDSVRIYAGLPVEVHLLFADVKLDELIQTAGSDKGAGKTRTEELLRAKSTIKEAQRKYEYFRTGDEGVLSEEWGFSWVPPRPDFPAVGKSPLSLLEHLWIGYEEATQTKFMIMVAAVAYSPAQLRQHRSLDDSIDLMKKAIDEIGSSGAWSVHWSSEARATISLPREFEPVSLLEGENFRLQRKRADGSPQALVIVSRTHPGPEEQDIAPERYRDKRIERARQKFPDMTVVELGECRSGAGAFETSFTYQYTWEGDPVMSLVHVRLIDGILFEVSYVALAESFSRKEAELIIRSFHKL